MATSTKYGLRVGLQYSDKGSYNFGRILLTATDQQLFKLAEDINDVQSDAATKITVNETFLII